MTSTLQSIDNLQAVADSIRESVEAVDTGSLSESDAGRLNTVHGLSILLKQELARIVAKIETESVPA